jgi:starch synthase (maltosyl-transferring)
MENVVLTIVNLDFDAAQAGFVDLDLAELGLEPDEPFLVTDTLTGNSYTWQGPRNYVELRPDLIPAHVFVVEKII